MIGRWGNRKTGDGEPDRFEEADRRIGGKKGAREA